MKKEYDTFVDSLEELTEGEEIGIVVRDLTPGRRKYESQYVKAIVASAPQKLSDGDILWLTFQRGTRYPQPWAIKVLEIIGEYKNEA